MFTEQALLFKICLPAFSSGLYCSLAGEGPSREDMRHLSEVLKIISGAVNCDVSKVKAYSELLASKLESDGQGSSAQRVRKALTNGKVAQLEASRFVSGDRIPVDAESRLHLADFETVGPKAEEVFLDDSAAAVVNDFITFTKASDKLMASGLDLTPSLLAYGPPGCGKTALARHLASELDLPLLTARVDTLVSSYLGSTSKNIRALFEYAMSRPCLLFLDEFDSIAKLRDDTHELGELKRVVISLLQNIDGLDSNTVLMAATNHEHLLDSAVWRRFAYKAFIGKPSEDTRTRLFEKFLAPTVLSSKELALYVELSQGLTGSEIRQIAEDARRAALIEGRDAPDEADLLARIVRHLIPQPEWLALPPEGRARRLRELGPHVFTYRRLGKIVNVSVGHVSNLLREPEGVANEAGDSASNQGRTS